MVNPIPYLNTHRLDQENKIKKSGDSPIGSRKQKKKYVDSPIGSRK
jgi:hypothetical protein